jgi:hypothetical protein
VGSLDSQASDTALIETCQSTAISPSTDRCLTLAPAEFNSCELGYDRTHELSGADLAREELYLTDDPDDLRAADFFIVTVPTPIDDAHRPR